MRIYTVLIIDNRLCNGRGTGCGAAEGADGGADVGLMNKETKHEAVRSGERTGHLELMPTDRCHILTGAVGRMGRMPSGEYS